MAFKSRSQRIMSLLEGGLPIPKSTNSFTEVIKTFQNDVRDPSENTEQLEYTDLRPLEPLPSTSASSLFDEEIPPEKENLSISTLNLIDDCLSGKFSADSDLITNFDLSPLTSVEEPPEIYTCFHCELTFDNKGNLTVHIQEHMDVDNVGLQANPPQLDQEYANDNDIICQKAYFCTHCNVAYKRKNNLRQHIQSTHVSRRETYSTFKRPTTLAKRAEVSFLRISGQSYTSSTNKEITQRKRKDYICKNCQFKCSNKFTDEEKEDYFVSFWKIAKEDRCQNRQRQYIANHVTETEPERRRVLQSSRKKRSLQYFLAKGTERIQVCRSFFLSVFDVSEKFVRVSLEKKSDVGVVSLETRGKFIPKNKTEATTEEHARQHILTIPAVESHYCRKSTKKRYLSAQLNIEKLYDLYLEKCGEDNEKILESNDDRTLIKPVSKALYKKYFYSYDLTFYKPKKDLCNTCNRYNGLTIEEKEAEKDCYIEHIHNKNRARELKNEEVEKRKNSHGKHTVVNFDLQAVLECPKGSVSSIFYKRKLAVYNLTTYDLISKEGTCNIWNETEGNRGSTEIGTCIFQYIKDHPNVESFFFMSDSCGGQNLNQFFATALLHAVRLTECKVIDHVFYEPGHSQQEGDSMHSTIERASKNVQVNVPSEWNMICRLARKVPKPYNVVSINHDSFIDWTELANDNKDTPRYKTVTGDIVAWRKIKWFQYRKENPDSIFFKYNYDDKSFMEIQILKGVGRPQALSLTTLPKAYNHRLPITLMKYKDLMDLCKTKVIPTEHHKFFEDLPYEKACDKKDKKDQDKRTSAKDKALPSKKKVKPTTKTQNPKSKEKLTVKTKKKE